MKIIIMYDLSNPIKSDDNPNKAGPMIAPNAATPFNEPSISPR